jgi:hypothetical protein
LPDPTATIFDTPGNATGCGIACPCAIVNLLIQFYRARNSDRHLGAPHLVFEMWDTSKLAPPI